MLLSFLAGSGLTLLVERIWLSSRSDLIPEKPEVHAGQWRLINPLVTCASVPKGKSPKEAPLESRIRQVIADYRKKVPVDQVGVFFRDLNNGPTMGIDSDKPFIAASLMKVPIAIMYLRAAERNPALLQKKFAFHPGYAMSNHVQTIDPPEPMTIGQEYSVDELIKRMLIKSDNVSAAMLIDEMNETDVVRVLQEMGIPMTVVGGSDASIQVEDYASVFRILYNATFLDKATSNYLLEILTQTSHRGGLREGVKSDVTVASKFGEHRLGTIQQYHECGIVYFPERPYLLCVMTRGEEVAPLYGAVKEVSSAVYDFVSSTQKKSK